MDKKSNSCLINSTVRVRKVETPCCYCRRKIDAGDAYTLYRLRIEGKAKNKAACWACANLLEAIGAVGENIAEVTRPAEFALVYSDHAEQIREHLETLGWQIKGNKARPPRFNNL